MKEKTFLDIFLEYKMKSSEGEEMKSALNSTIAEEEQCIEQGCDRECDLPEAAER